ncbi:hypothetical protein J6O48_02945 [bacterium]|nr:hypothetical protein [bacterium]
MKLTLKTEKLKDMVSRAIKGVGNNKLIPITSMMAIEVIDNKLSLITTDATNYLYVSEDKVVSEDFYVVVDANLFSKLISKMTCENITLTVKQNFVLEVKGNGTYKIELPLDENGQPIKFPDPVNTVDLSHAEEVTVNRTTIQVILDTIKPALAVTLENPCYTGYYVGQQIVATDTYKIASMGVKLFIDSARLVSPEFMDLLAVMNAEKITVDMTDTDIVCSTPDCIVCGKFMEGIDEYAIDAIMGLVNTEFGSFCAVPKSALLQLLDRLSLFVGTYDKNAIYLTFTNAGLQVSSKAANSVEIIDYVTSEDFKDFTCAVDISMLINEVKSIQNDVIELYYGEDNAIKMTDGNITIIVALLDDTE